MGSTSTFGHELLILQAKESDRYSVLSFPSSTHPRLSIDIVQVLRSSPFRQLKKVANDMCKSGLRLELQGQQSRVEQKL